MAHRNHFFSSCLVRLGWLGLVAALWLTPIYRAQAEIDQFSYDLQLIDALNRVDLVNYALLHIDLLLERYPDQADHIHYATARFNFARGRRRQAEEALARIPESSPFYNGAALLRAQQAIQRGDLTTAAEAYQAYFDEVDRPVSSQPADVEAFREAVLYYAQTKIETGEAQAAGNILGLLRNLPEDEAPDPDGLSVTVADAIFTAMENRLEAERSIDRPLIEQQIEQLLDIQWRHGGQQRITVQAFIQAARGRILLGEPQSAIELLQSISEAAAMLESRQPDAPSPVPSAFYYYARAYELTGAEHMRRNRRDQARQAWLRAAAFYNRRLLERYPDSSLADRALMRYGHLDRLMQEHFDGSLPPPVTGVATGLPMKIQEADRLYNAGRFEEAIPLYLEVLRLGRRHRNVVNSAERLVISYGRSQRFLEAMAVASYLADAFPEAEAAGNAMLQAGRFLFQHARELEDEEQKAMLTDFAMSVWDRFVDIAPGHGRAADIAFFVAEYYYSQALNLVQKARGGETRAEREELNELARQAFRRSIPFYERMLERFPATPNGIRSLYKLGWVYYNIDERLQAAELFSRYSQLETAPAFSDDRLRAKLHAGEQWMLSDSPQRAIPELRQLLAWYQGSPGGLDMESEVARRIREDAANYLAWSYDLVAETRRPQLREIDREIERFEQLIAAARAQSREAQVIQDQAEGEIAEAREDFANLQQTLLADLPQPEAMALDELMLPEAELRELSPEDRERTLAPIRQRARELGRQYRQRELDNRRGEIEDWEEERRQQRRRLAESEEEIAATQERLENHRQQLAQAEEEEEQAQTLLEEAEEPLRERRRGLEELEREIEELQERREQAAAAARGHPDPAARERARQLLELAEQRITERNRSLQNRRQEYEERRRQAAPRIEELRERLEIAQRQVEESTAAIPRLQEEKRRLAFERQIVEDRLDAYGAGIAVLQAQVEALEQAPEQREAKLADQDYEGLVQAVNEQFGRLRDSRTEKAEFLAERATDQIQGANDRIEGWQESIAELTDRREPLFAELKEKKREALEQFKKFLESHPNSNYVPSHMARIGSIYLELEEYDNAVEFLNRLASRFPDHEATANAIFDLGRAQFEAGRGAEAIATFQRIEDRFAEQSAGNLEYIARQSLVAEGAQLSLQAYRELLARAEDPEHPDYPELLGEQGRYRERLLYRASTAALQAEEYQQAVQLAEQLLAANQRTAYFFQVQMNIAQAARAADPPDFGKAERALGEIVRFAQDEALKNEALIEFGKTLMMNEALGAVGLRRALSQFSMLVMAGGGEVTIMADLDDPAVRPFVEEAIYRSALCHALLGNQERRDLLVNEYRRLFPQGQYLARINTLPAPRY